MLKLVGQVFAVNFLDIRKTIPIFFAQAQLAYYLEFLFNNLTLIWLLICLSSGWGLIFDLQLINIAWAIRFLYLMQWYVLTKRTVFVFFLDAHVRSQESTMVLVYDRWLLFVKVVPHLLSRTKRMRHLVKLRSTITESIQHVKLDIKCRSEVLVIWLCFHFIYIVQ